MIVSFLRLASLACTAIVLVSFGWFATDEMHKGSRATVAQIGSDGAPGAGAVQQVDVNQPDPPPRTERIREKRHGAVREAIDDANDRIVASFSGIVSGYRSVWAQRIVTTLLALLVFGLGLRMLAAWTPRLLR